MQKICKEFEVGFDFFVEDETINKVKKAEN